MEEREQFDVSEYSFDEFISFIFAHEPSADWNKQKPWYFSLEVIYDPRTICVYYVRLFRQPAFLLNQFSTAQLNQGLWAIHGGALDCAVSCVVSDTDLPFAVREECVRSMADLFRLLFAGGLLQESSGMWWDSLCYDWHCGTRNRERGGEDLRMQDVMFETLTKILRFDCEFCQFGALHGLGHLHHPRTWTLVHTFIAEHPALSAERKQYALKGAAFQVL
ncbi:MAG: hypothetical protein WA192_00770 [Candidatus Acidiferrales bacterium]